MLEGLGIAVAPSSLLIIAVGVLIGITVGALPGFTATMGTALVLPFTFVLPRAAPGAEDGLELSRAVHRRAVQPRPRSQP